MLAANPSSVSRHGVLWGWCRSSRVVVASMLWIGIVAKKLSTVLRDTGLKVEGIEEWVFRSCIPLCPCKSHAEHIGDDSCRLPMFCEEGKLALSLQYFPRYHAATSEQFWAEANGFRDVLIEALFSQYKRE